MDPNTTQPLPLPRRRTALFLAAGCTVLSHKLGDDKSTIGQALRHGDSKRNISQLWNLKLGLWWVHCVACSY